MSEWQPIETAPKDGTRVLLAYAQGVVMSGCWTKLEPEWADHWTEGRRPRFGADPTHWMPLPPPPKS